MAADPSQLDTRGREAAELILGYLNFSSGSPDANFLSNLNLLFARAAKGEKKRTTESEPWLVVGQWLRKELRRLSPGNGAFQDVKQAEGVIQQVWQHVLPAYRQFHSDLLFHVSSRELFQPLFVGRVCEAVLAQGAPWEDTDRVTAGAIRQLNDYVGHRPVPALATHKHEPYAHEFVRPIPIYIEGAGAAPGPYADVVIKGLQILREADEELLRAAHFDPDLMEELAYDPRAYDFEHPANKRPNYHFGQWDPHRIDNQGRFRRFVAQQVTLEALMERVRQPGEIPAEESLLEGGAVLAGTMLMAAGVSGWGPQAHDSETTLVTLLPHIAAYRDEFYKRLIKRISGPHGKRLQDEAKRLKQPFASARQHLNAALTRRRALQLSHAQLAKLFAQMGFPDAAAEHANVVPASSVRMLCQIECLLCGVRQAVEAGSSDEALRRLGEIDDILKRGIQCGAIIDPWNIFGFDAHYSLFPAVENSIRDFRADDLAELIEHVLSDTAMAWCSAAAADEQAHCQQLDQQLRCTSQWWHQFAAHEVSCIEAPNAADAYDAARDVAQAINQWHRDGAAGGDVAFWAPYAERFDSAKAYAMVIESMLNQSDYVASMALLVHWLSRAEETGLEQGDGSFNALALRWLRQLQDDEQFEPSQQVPDKQFLIRRLFEYLEANAEEYGQAPQFELGNGKYNVPDAMHEEALLDDEGDEEDSIFDAAYEGVVYRDSTDDGFEGEVFDYGDASQDELEAESRRQHLRLGFLTCLAQLWKFAAWASGPAAEGARPQRDILLSWFAHAQQIVGGLDLLIDQVSAFRIPAPEVDVESLIEYDRQRSIRESIIERVIAARVDVSDAAFFILAAAGAQEGADDKALQWPVDLADDERLAVMLTAAMLSGDRREAEARFDEYLEAIEYVQLLYVPLARGGDPHKIAATRIQQRRLQNLLVWLPRLGLLEPTRLLIDAARRLEREHPAGPGSVTEFDDLFEVGYRAMVESIVDSAAQWPRQTQDSIEDDATLVSYLEQLTQAMIETWLAHSRTLRLSVLERVSDEKPWSQLVRFIRRYGGDLFTQQFLNLGNLRAIQYQGVDVWLDQLQERPGPPFKLVEEIGSRISDRKAVKCLSLILDAVTENYAEYRDYNATTTQSDRGELLYMLLDFLRLRVSYDRVAWNLRPVVMAHEILVRRDRNHAAQLWRRALSERFNDEADKFLRKLKRLERKYAMKMPTVADRLAERFVFPMTVDRLRAMVEPATAEAGSDGDATYFRLLEQETTILARESGGVGLDLPPWLMALEEEVQLACCPLYQRDDDHRLAEAIPKVKLTAEEIDDQLNDWISEADD